MNARIAIWAAGPRRCLIDAVTRDNRHVSIAADVDSGYTATRAEEVEDVVVVDDVGRVDTQECSTLQGNAHAWSVRARWADVVIRNSVSAVKAAI